MNDINHIGQLKPDPKNARKHNQRNIGQIVSSLQEVGASRSIVIDEDNIILAGNGVIEAAGIAGIENVRVIEADGNEIIAVKRKGLTPEQKTRLALWDNRAAELAEWDVDQLQIDFDSGMLDGMFSDIDLDKLGLDTKGKQPEDAEPQIDKAEELRVKWGVELGQLWRLGEHRLICGDCTDAAVVARLLGEDKADGIITDPPYSSGGFQEAGKSSGSIGTRANDTIQRDNLSTRGYRLLLLDALEKLSGINNLYIFTDWRMWIECFDVSERSGWRVRSMLVWDKEQMGMGLPWRSQHELILYGKQTPAKMMDGKRGNVLNAKRTGNENHPTEKPIELIEQLIENTDGNIFVDPFSGSGTTLIACERLSRKCRAVEISPAYCAVAIQRWVDVTGGEPVLLT